MGLPNIAINFTTKANTAITRSAKGIICLVLKDTTKTVILNTYKYFADVKEADWTAENLQAIKDAFNDGAPKIYAVRIGTGKAWADVRTAIESLAFNWIAYLDSTGQSDLVTYIKARNTANPNKPVKAVVYNTTTPDDEHFVNFCTEKVLRVGSTTEIDGYKYLGRIVGLFAALPFTRSATYYIFNDLQSVKEPTDVGSDISGGKLMIINDYGEPKIARAINSLTTLSSGKTESMKKVTVIEAMDLIKDDIATTFKQNYIGKFKNNYDNQMNFVAAINHYFEKLAIDDILDKYHDNRAEIDVVSQRSALIDAGKIEAEDWNNITVKKNTVGSTMYLTGDVKILDAIEDLKFGISVTV